MGPRRRGAMVGSWQGRRECPSRLLRARLRYQGGAGGRPARPGGTVLHCERGSWRFRRPAACTIPRVARVGRILTRRAGPVGLALTAWDIWRRIPPKHRRTILKQARKHGPTIAKRAVEYRRRRR